MTVLQDNNAATEHGTRTLNVELPAGVYWHVRECATQSRLSLKEFMAIFCKEAKAIETSVRNEG